MHPTGTLVTEALEFDGGRQVSVYVPPEPADSIVFAGDGQWHIARLVEVLEAAGERSTMVVGVHGMGDDDERLKEYVPGFDAARFAAHERFFADDVRTHVRDRFGVAFPAARTAVWGASLGGELALAMGLGHPDVYGVVFSASPGAGFLPPTPMPSPLPRVYLVAGMEEPFFLDNATRWSEALAEAGADVMIEARAGEHGGAFWGEEFPRMVAWAFSP
jgi:pimeloyl-ACP methyl ester carboxylesterase